MRLLNPLHTKYQVIVEWRYITAFISDALGVMSRQTPSPIDNTPTPLIDFQLLHRRAERRAGIHITHKQLLELSPDKRREVIADIERRRMRAYNLFLRTTSTQEFSR